MLLSLGSLFAGVALGVEVDIPFDVPAEVPMFEQIRYLTATGKDKGGCEAAVAEGLEDIERKSGRAGMDRVLVFVSDDFVPITSVPCEEQGKNSVVKLDAFAVKLGQGDTYPMITAERAAEMVRGLKQYNFNVKGQLAVLSVTDQRGGLYLRLPPEDFSDPFKASENTNDRAVVLLRDAVLPAVPSHEQIVAGFAELEGLSSTWDTKRTNSDGEVVSERWRFDLPSAVMREFRDGEITEQGLVDGSAVFRNNSRTDVSMVDADD